MPVYKFGHSCCDTNSTDSDYKISGPAISHNVYQVHCCMCTMKKPSFINSFYFLDGLLLIYKYIHDTWTV